MEATILDPNFNQIKVVDLYESFIWVDRYDSYGDFELFMNVDLDLLYNIKIGSDIEDDYYIWISESEHMMIIEEIIIITDVEEGPKLKITGRSLESLLERRIIWTQTNLTGDFQTAIQKILNENIISPEINERKIPNIIFQESTDPEISKLTINVQRTGTVVYLAIQAACVERHIGFKITQNDTNQFVFTLYKGIDRSYNQEINPYVIFSPGFDNLINSDYVENNKTLRNVALVAGEGEGLDRKTTVVGSGSGQKRREHFIDARDISSSTNEGELTPEQYTDKLIQRGKEKNATMVYIKKFEADIDTTQMFIYGRDFFIGDIVQIRNEYGMEASARMSEIIFATDKEGFHAVPTCSAIKNEVN